MYIGKAGKLSEKHNDGSLVIVKKGKEAYLYSTQRADIIRSLDLDDLPDEFHESSIYVGSLHALVHAITQADRRLSVLNQAKTETKQKIHLGEWTEEDFPF